MTKRLLAWAVVAAAASLVVGVGTAGARPATFTGTAAATVDGSLSVSVTERARGAKGGTYTLAADGFAFWECADPATGEQFQAALGFAAETAFVATLAKGSLSGDVTVPFDSMTGVAAEFGCSKLLGYSWLGVRVTSGVSGETVALADVTGSF